MCPFRTRTLKGLTRRRDKCRPLFCLPALCMSPLGEEHAMLRSLKHHKGFSNEKRNPKVPLLTAAFVVQSQAHTEGPGQAPQSYNNGIPVSTCRVQAKGPASHSDMTRTKRKPCPLPPSGGTKMSITKQSESVRQARQCDSAICGPGPISGWDRWSGSSPLTMQHREYLSAATAKHIWAGKEGTRCETYHHCGLEQWSPTLEAPGTSFREDCFQSWRVEGWEWRDGFRVTEVHYCAPMSIIIPSALTHIITR